MKTYRILPEADAEKLAALLTQSDWTAGLARTSELTGTVKRNDEILEHDALPRLTRIVLNHPAIQLDCIPLKAHPMKFSRYGEQHSYGAHTDAPWMGSTRTDLSVTLWLSSPDDYEGGELVIDGRGIKGVAGECLVYDCGRIHEVMPVTSGARIAAVTWIQSRVREAARRQLISDFRRFLKRFETDDSRDRDAFLEGGRIYSALMRAWME